MHRRRRTAGALATVGVLALTVMGASPVSAGPGDFFPGPAKLSVRGAAASQDESGNYGLGVWARTAGEAEKAEGQFRYGHRGPDGEFGVAGDVHCLAREASGLIQVSGRVFASGGQNLVGKDFAATIDVDSSPQRFSDLKIGEAGSFAGCSGGLPRFHPVTEGGYQATGGQ